MRFGSARYSVPRELVGRHVKVAGDGEVVIEWRDEVVARHRLVAPGECSIVDDHYGGPRRVPARAVRARTGPERAFLALGPAAEGFLGAAAAARTTKLASELGHVVALEAAWGRGPLIAAPGRAREFRRFNAADVRSILEAGIGVPTVAAAGEVLDVDLPAVPVRSIDDYRLEVLA